jgi:hypothetical protein
MVVSPAAPVETVVAPPTNSGPSRPEPFQWRQLYARDYHAYVKNLRALGCPEPTLRAIVAADVHAVFEQRADALEKKLQDLANSSWSSQLGAWTNEAAWKSELLRLPDEEAAMVADYLDETMPAATNLASASAAPHNHSPALGAADAPLAAPLIAQPIDLAALNLDPGQLQAISDLQQTFLQKIGGPNQDPNDPAYRARWQSAQAEVDTMLQGMIGDQAYQEYQLKAYANAQAKLSGHSAQ